MAGSNFIPNLMQWERKEHDLYETPIEATQALVEFLIGLSDSPPDGCTVHEPASASGKISKVLEVAGFDVTSEDIRDEPNIYGRRGVDYLRSPPGDYDLVITNPPFSMAVPFIEKALQEAEVVCMLLKSDFWQTKGRLPLFRGRLKPAMKLDMTWRLAFLKEERGNSPFMNTCWVIWIRDPPKHVRYELLEKPSRIPDIYLEGDMMRLGWSVRAMRDCIDQWVKVYK